MAGILPVRIRAGRLTEMILMDKTDSIKQIKEHFQAEFQVEMVDQYLKIGGLPCEDVKELQDYAEIFENNTPTFVLSVVSEEDFFDVTIKEGSGQVLSMSVAPLQTVGDLKKAIMESLHLEGSIDLFRRQGLEMQDDYILAHYIVVANCTITMDTTHATVIPGEPETC